MTLPRSSTSRPAATDLQSGDLLLGLLQGGLWLVVLCGHPLQVVHQLIVLRLGFLLLLAHLPQLHLTAEIRITTMHKMAPILGRASACCSLFGLSPSPGSPSAAPSDGRNKNYNNAQDGTHFRSKIRIEALLEIGTHSRSYCVLGAICVLHVLSRVCKQLLEINRFRSTSTLLLHGRVYIEPP